MPTNDRDRRDFIQKAKEIFDNNTFEGYSKWKRTHFRFIAPASTWYVFQWLWDTAFHAIVLSHFDLPRAKNEINTFLLGQREDGFLPHVIFWSGKRILPKWAYLESDLSLRPNTTAITQPPLLPIAVEEIYKKDRDKKFLEDTLDKLYANHIWLLNNRDPDHDGLISIISPNESGLDELPVFQTQLGYLGNEPFKVHRAFRKPDVFNKLYRFNSESILKKDYFNYEELLFNCIFIESARSLARLYQELNQKNKVIELQDIAYKSEHALLTKCWSEEDEIFYPLYSKQEKMAKIKTVTSLMPIFLEGCKGDKLQKLVEKHLTNPREFWTDYPIPSVAADEPYFMPKNATSYYKYSRLLWRGPTWMNTNWFIVKGLRNHGLHSFADHIVQKSLQMVKQDGFREYYNPLTGEGYSFQNFGWSTLILDLLPASSPTTSTTTT